MANGKQEGKWKMAYMPNGRWQMANDNEESKLRMVNDDLQTERKQTANGEWQMANGE